MHRPTALTLQTLRTWPVLLAALAFGAVEWLALWRSRAADRRHKTGHALRHH